MAGAVATLALVACGSGTEQNVHEPSGKFKVAVSTASFPATQTLSEHTHLVITVRNAGSKPIPNLAVTICNVTCTYPAPKGEGSSSQAFAHSISQPYVANPSRPIWVVDRPPGPCYYSCQAGGQGAYVTAYANTWALGHTLAPGHSATFAWAVTAVTPGRWVVAWDVAAGLNGKAKAVLSDGSPPSGTFTVHIATKPQQSYVNNQGQIVIVSKGKGVVVVSKGKGG